MQFCIVTRARLADLFISVSQKSLLPHTPKLQGLWLTLVVEVLRTPQQLGACDHVGNCHGKRYGFRG